MTIGARLNNVRLKIVQQILALNLFESNTTNPETIRKQKISTRVYIILLAITIAIVLFYSSVTDRIVVKKHMNPSMTDYEHLLGLGLTTVDCTCNRISIPYSTFVTQLEVESYHDACSNGSLLAILTPTRVIQESVWLGNRADFRSWENSFVDGINRLCLLAEDSIQNDVQAFLASSMLVYQLIPRTQFEKQMAVTLHQVQTATPIAFARTLDLLRTMFQANALLDIYLIGWDFTIANDAVGANATFLSVPRYHQNECSCVTTRACTSPAQLIFKRNDTSYYTIEGIVLGCFVLETILRSSLSCFYSIRCIIELRNAKIIEEYFPFYTVNWSLALNTTSKRFSINDTIETLAYNMFIESWTNNVSYEMFFEACMPKECTYSYHVRFDILEMITTFLSVFSGLSLGLRLLVPCLISVVERARQRLRVTPT
jgi:hypothetical protein